MDAKGHTIRDALSTIEPGRWVVGVSGGLDSVALLVGVRRYRTDVEPIVAHLDHQSRGAESDGDREFVIELACRLRLPTFVKRIDEVAGVTHPNLEARYRLARLAVFRQALAKCGGYGVLLAQHADDRAETTLLRLLRGGEPWAMDGLHRDTMIGDLRIVRPLIEIRRTSLHRFLVGLDQPWREDSSNASDAFSRNRVRALLREQPALTNQLLQLADSAHAFRMWVDANAPSLPVVAQGGTIADLPDPLARRSIRRWLIEQGIEHVAPAQIESILGLTRDGAGSSAVNLPGGHIARRKRGGLLVERAR